MGGEGKRRQIVGSPSVCGRQEIGQKDEKYPFDLKMRKNDGFWEKSPFRQELIPEKEIFSPFCMETVLLSSVLIYMVTVAATNEYDII